MRTVALMLVLLCCSLSARGADVRAKSPKGVMEALLREAVTGADGAFFDRARLRVNLLVHNPRITSFGAILSYRDFAVGRENYAADSRVVVEAMRELVKDRPNVAVVCLAWHFQDGGLLLYGGASYGTEAGMEDVSP